METCKKGVADTVRFRTELIGNLCYLSSRVQNMKKLIIIAAFSLTLLAGCVGWAHWGGRHGWDHRRDQRQEQQDDRHDNRR
jgi:hypothetical protein